MNVSAKYLDTYKDGGIYDDPQYGGPYISRGIKFARFAGKFIKPMSRVLCLGCGIGYEVVEYLNQGHDAYGTEFHSIENIKPLEGKIIKAVAPNLPFKDKQFDLLHCTEVLEHIPTEETDSFLNECKRVSDKHFFSVATEMDSYRTHINLQKPGWWLDKFEQKGFNVKNFQYKPIVSNQYGDGLYNIYYTDGITVLCNIQ